MMSYGGMVAMLGINYTSLRQNLKFWMDKVTENYETALITRKDNKNVVMMSEEAYNNLMENVYIMEDKENYAWITDSIKQLEEGKAQSHELIEVCDE